ncbi:hypothetical protein RJ641_027256 [Dillenia turbinata]|uniref:Uncharacterized protein n=1 Tax=Dillenia turbinata TaxID=194707 RepID=A0AAN8ZHZ9_9MAGN
MSDKNRFHSHFGWKLFLRRLLVITIFGQWMLESGSTRKEMRFPVALWRREQQLHRLMSGAFAIYSRREAKEPIRYQLELNGVDDQNLDYCVTSLE